LALQQVWLFQDIFTDQDHPVILVNLPAKLAVSLMPISSWLQVAAAEPDITFAFQTRRKGQGIMPTTSHL
jgi:hypothetical protein